MLATWKPCAAPGTVRTAGQRPISAFAAPSVQHSRLGDAHCFTFGRRHPRTASRLCHKRASPRLIAAASADTFSVPPPPPMVASTPEDRKRLWLAAIKPPIYSVSAVPTMVGFAAAYFDTGVFSLARFLLAIACGILVILWLNFSNDAWDAETQVDVGKAESVVRLFGSPKRVLAIAFSALFAGAAGLGCLCATSGDPRVGWLLLAAIACGTVYQAPPFRLSYKGVGEPLCFVAFGPLATNAFYLAAVSGPGFLAPLTPAASASAIVVGLTTTAILLCSHIHQEETDRAAGKRSPVVRLGVDAVARVLAGIAVATHAIAIGAAALGQLPVAAAAATALSIPAARTLLAFVAETKGDPSRSFRSKFFATRWHALTGLLLAAGLAGARLLAR